MNDRYALTNSVLSLKVDPGTGIVSELRTLADGMDWVISPALLDRYGFGDNRTCLLGKSRLQVNGTDLDTGCMKPSRIDAGNDRIRCTYNLDTVRLSHEFRLVGERVEWTLRVENTTQDPLHITKMLHWFPVSYVMHDRIEENLSQSCSLVPSISGGHTHVLCKKRDGSRILTMTNPSGQVKSIGSLCLYQNLFFTKSAPSLNGLILHNTVHAWKSPEIEAHPQADWPYRDMYRTLVLEPGATFEDTCHLQWSEGADDEAALRQAGCAVLTYEPVVHVGHPVSLRIDHTARVAACRILRETGVERSIPHPEQDGDGCLRLEPFPDDGERKVELVFEDGSTAFLFFAVYADMTTRCDALLAHIHRERFIDDPASPDFCGYRSTSPQGESCAKGAALLARNLLGWADPAEIAQAERHCALYLRRYWLQDDFTAIKKYPGGFARLFDLDYLLLSFSLLSFCDNEHLRLHDRNEYLLWAFRTAMYRLTDTPDKLPREKKESENALCVSWLVPQLMDALRTRGLETEADHLAEAWKVHVDRTSRQTQGYAFVETEHYFDNAGMAMFAETMLNAGKTAEGMKAAELLLYNVSRSTDYRNHAPDRWWEALACMYHNLWAVFAAKAMLTAYEHGGGTPYLFAAYRSMMPMFHNYDWQAVSAPRALARGEGVSAYCLTSPNLNNEQCSRNRFGQSIFTGDFFDGLALSGDDWDLGADLVVYLMTFGQKTYVVGQGESLRCVNGALAQTADAVTVTSFAAYPMACFFEADSQWIRCNAGVMLRRIVMQDGACVAVEIERRNDHIVPIITCEKDGRVNEIHPLIRIVDAAMAEVEQTPCPAGVI